MSQEILVERLFETLIAGERTHSRAIVDECLKQSASPAQIITSLFWPTYELLEKLYRNDQLSKLPHHLGSRLLRVLVDQNSSRLLHDRRSEPVNGSVGKTIFALCGPRDSDELGAQMACDLLDHAGFNVKFGGGNIANDEILAFVNEQQPSILLMFASGANDLPNIRQLIDTVKEIGACDRMKIAVGGGVFNRADGLAEEIGADIWAKSPLEMVEILSGKADSVREVQVPLRRKRSGPSGSKREAA
jgi:MerR family transcriptional regulator, light-induced transcriptional regulator